MKITVEISDDILIEAKQYAALHGQSFRQLLEQSLRTKLEKKPKVKIRDGSFQGEGPMPDLDWPTMRALIYEGRGG